MASQKYRDSCPFDNRVRESTKLLEKYPDRKPIICHMSDQNTIIKTKLVKSKYLVPSSQLASEFVAIIRNKLKMKSSTANLFILINGQYQLSMNQTIFEIYNEFKSDDGFLYIEYCGENTFG